MKNPTNLPCSPDAAATIIGNLGYEGYGHYIKLLQVFWKQKDRWIEKDKMPHIITVYGMDQFITDQLLTSPALFFSDETRYFVVEAKSQAKRTAIPPVQIEPEHDLQIYIKKWFPIVSSMDIQMSVKNCEQLLKDYPKLLIVEKLKAMENYKGLTKKYVNVYLTLNNWCAMALERGWTAVGQVKAAAI